MGRTKGAINKSKSIARSDLSDDARVTLVANLILEIVIEEQSKISETGYVPQDC